jgi:hypothetical protein
MDRRANFFHRFYARMRRLSARSLTKRRQAGGRAAAEHDQSRP